MSRKHQSHMRQRFHSERSQVRRLSAAESLEAKQLLDGYGLVNTEAPADEFVPAIVSHDRVGGETPSETTEAVSVETSHLSLDITLRKLLGESDEQIEAEYVAEFVFPADVAVANTDGTLDVWFEGVDQAADVLVTASEECPPEHYKFGEEFELRPGDSMRVNEDGSVDIWRYKPSILPSIPLDELPGDIDGDGRVSFPDFLILSANFGKKAPEGDIDGDGKVEFDDFLVLSVNFGSSVDTVFSRHVGQDWDGDGKDDHFFFDKDGDGKWDQANIDSNEDGVYEQTWLDSDDDGDWDHKFCDTNGDGYQDTQKSDLDNDGKFDTKWVDANKDGKVDPGEASSINPQEPISGPSPRP